MKPGSSSLNGTPGVSFFSTSTTAAKGMAPYPPGGEEEEEGGGGCSRPLPPLPSMDYYLNVVHPFKLQAG